MINTDCERIRTDKKLLYGDLTYRVRGAIFTVYNELGFGHKENIYQKALIKEFEILNIPYKQEVGLDVKYKGDIVGKYRPDFVIDDKIIIEIKSVEFMTKSYEEQLLHYLKTTGYSLGFLVNFGSNRLFIKRLIWTNNPRVSVRNQCESIRNQFKSVEKSA
jgi:GxxExxY protein